MHQAQQARLAMATLQRLQRLPPRLPMPVCGRGPNSAELRTAPPQKWCKLLLQRMGDYSAYAPLCKNSFTENVQQTYQFAPQSLYSSIVHVWDAWEIMWTKCRNQCARAAMVCSAWNARFLCRLPPTMRCAKCTIFTTSLSPSLSEQQA